MSSFWHFFIFVFLSECGIERGKMLDYVEAESSLFSYSTPLMARSLACRNVGYKSRLSQRLPYLFINNPFKFILQDGNEEISG